MVRIALDAMGGDAGGTEKIISGAVQAVNESDLEVTLLGDAALIRSLLQKIKDRPDLIPGGNSFQSGWEKRIHLVPTSQVVGMDESPFDAVRKKEDSSIMVAFDLLRQGEAEAVVSAGNSGATMAAAIKKLGRLEKISRPGIAGILPTLKGPVVMMDVGANVDCRAQHLFQFGIMAAAFVKIIFGIERPRIGLLSIGEEGGKGNALVKKAHSLFQQGSWNYIGNVEGRDTFQGDVDVIVCDGFVGNVCLKLSEGLAEAAIAMLREEISKTFKAKIGYLLAKEAFVNFRKRVDYAEYGGAPLLGLNGTGVICHGGSNATAIKNGIKVAANLVLNNVNDHISKMLNEYDPDGGSQDKDAASTEEKMRAAE